MRNWRPSLIGAIALIALCLATLGAVAGAAAAAPSGPSVAGGDEFGLLIKPDGTLWGTGDNTYGQLGVGSTTQKRVLTRVGAAADWAVVAAGDRHGLALKTDGTLWAWGYNAYGQLGLGDTTNRTSPVQVGTATDWVAVAGGDNFTLALKADGSLWAWGSNSDGQLGVGDQTQRLSPVQVGSATDWASVSPGGRFALALKADGSLYTWGRNTHAQLGLGNTTMRTSPTRVGSALYEAAQAGDDDVAAIRTDGTLWTWGYNSYGQLGDGTSSTTVYRTSPGQVGSASDWTVVARGDDHVVALRADGSLWAWGDDTYGQLGQGTTTHLSVPTQVGSATDWSAPVCGDDYTTAMRADGSRYVFGDNAYGQLGLGDTTSRWTPILELYLSDTTAPTVPGITSSTHPDVATWYANSSPSLAWTPSDDASGIAGYTYVLDTYSGTSVSMSTPKTVTSVSYTGKADALYYFHVRAVDRAGNWGPTLTRAVRIDTTAPVVTLTAPADGATYAQGADTAAAWVSTDNKSGIASQAATVDGSPIAKGASLDTFGAGTHTFSVTARDKAGNTTTQTATYTMSLPLFYDTVTSPNGGGTLLPGVATIVTWTTNTPVTSGLFTVSSVSSGGSVKSIGTVNADGTASYSIAWTPKVSAGSYRIKVAYGPDATTTTATDYSDSAFTIDTWPSVIYPNGGETLVAGIPVTVTWTSPAYSIGVFQVWAVSSGNVWSSIGYVAPTGAASYGIIWTPKVAAGSYRIAVAYGPVKGTYTITDYSNASFTVAAPAP